MSKEGSQSHQTRRAPTDTSATQRERRADGKTHWQKQDNRQRGNRKVGAGTRNPASQPNQPTGNQEPT